MLCRRKNNFLPVCCIPNFVSNYFLFIQVCSICSLFILVFMLKIGTQFFKLCSHNNNANRVKKWSNIFVDHQFVVFQNLFGVMNLSIEIMVTFDLKKYTFNLANRSQNLSTLRWWQQLTLGLITTISSCLNISKFSRRRSLSFQYSSKFIVHSSPRAFSLDLVGLQERIPTPQLGLHGSLTL